MNVRVFLSRHSTDPAPAGLTTINRRLAGHDLVRLTTGAPRDFYLCGPGPMVADLTAALRRAGVDQRAVHAESFTANQPTATVVEVPDGGREVTFTSSARTVLWTDAQRSVLDLAEAAGITVPAACRVGACGTCRLEIEDGSVSYLRAPALPLDPNECLACIAVPASRLSLTS
jgi:ferredoxin